MRRVAGEGKKAPEQAMRSTGKACAVACVFCGWHSGFWVLMPWFAGVVQPGA